MTIICFVGLVLAGAFFIRIKEVYTEGTRIINEISERNRKEIEISIFNNWRDRWDRIDEVSYTVMVFKFWIPVREFYEKAGCFDE